MQDYPYQGRQAYTSRMRIVMLLVRPSGTYNPMVIRPYETHYDMSVADDLNRRLNDFGGGSNPQMLAGMANRIIRPSFQHDGQVQIVNGWGQQRGVFIMTVEQTNQSGSKYKYHIQGYTSHYDLSYSGHADPRTEFFINSYVCTTESFVQTPTGAQSYDVVQESAQIVNGQLISSLGNGAALYGMRPNELFTLMQREEIMNNAYGAQNYHDDRHAIHTQVVTNRRENNMPANLLSNVIDSYKVGTAQLNFGQGRDEVFSRAKGSRYEPGLNEIDFFRALGNITGIQGRPQFTLENLQMLDPNLPNVATFVRLDHQGLSRLNTAGQSEGWHRADDMNAWAASTLVNVVPTIMMELMLTRFSFSATNHDRSQMNIVIVTFVKDLLYRHNLSRELEIFKVRFEREIIQDLTQNNQVGYRVTMDVDLFGDTVIDIQYGDQPMTRYVQPSFCDSLMTPVMTFQENKAFNNASDIKSILSNLDFGQRGLVMANDEI